ncbi:hypothetical protein C5167_018042 [Papaver somniferum]|uniref:Uncharacterized protein n=1 Tax=Papaver somniferum TaxID=3469 RepID=A0A4Y7IQ33_PAPSO|nr:hypothetical protein C5167_018042 [Papaver somniferum]
MYTRQGGNPRNVQQSQFIGDKNKEGQEHQLNDFSSRLQAAQSMVHDGNGVGRTGRALPSHAPIESPVDGGRGGGRTRHVLPSRSPIESPVLQRSRAGGISCAVHPMESPLNNDFLLTPRISPREPAQEYTEIWRRNTMQSRRSQQRNNLHDSPAENHNFSQPNRSRSASNSPVENNEEVGYSLQDGRTQRTTRKKTTNLAVAKRGKEKVSVYVFKEKFCGHYRHELINSIGSWVRQRDNCPLTYDKFDDMPEQKIARVIQNVRV